ncbi:MAG TPA: DNA polymerase domain-containing protein [Candidatus Bathyarchaeia archaeon]|nr:DNA polymerase domain-containing protein [Candidatus Bathyarchaeia archaeon]
MKHLGWILDIYHKPGQLVVWLKKSDGSCVRLVDEWKPKIHVGGNYRDLAELACKFHTDNSRFVRKFEKAGDLEKSRVLEIEVESDREAAILARKIQREESYSKYRLYDVDIPAPQVYLYQKDLFPLARVEAEQENDGKVRWLLKDSRKTIDFEIPRLQKLELQVQTVKNKRVQTFQDELSSVRLILENGESILIDSGKESDKILSLVETFREIDPDIVLTKGGDSFIFPYLARRALAHGILDRLILGREASPLQVYEVQGHSYFSYGKILYRETAARLLGRLHIDDHNAFISADCGLEGLFEISRTCIIPLQRASRATIGTNMTSLQFYHALKKDVLIPWNKNQPEEWKDGNELVIADRGGFIYEPEKGIHDQVGELDFTSLYPTLMVEKNLSGETVKCKCCPDSILRVPELDYHICKKQGIVPLSLKILLSRRMKFKELKKLTKDEAKKRQFDARQSALKWILVCSFGYLGFKNARFGKIDAHIATCAFSRIVLNQAIAIAEDHGFKLVHAIVDSMWLTKPGATRVEYEKLSALISKKVNLPLGFEGQYKWIVFLNSKIDPRVPVLNRYYGVFQDGTQKIRGIDLRRHDTPEIVRKCQSSMLDILTKADNSEEFRALIPGALGVLKGYATMLRDGRVPIEELVISKNLSKNPGEYTHHVAQAVAARQLLREGGSVHAGQQVNYVLTRDSLNVPENLALPWDLVDENTVYDADKYVDLLVSSVANLLLPFGYDVKTLRRQIS